MLVQGPSHSQDQRLEAKANAKKRKVKIKNIQRYLRVVFTVTQYYEKIMKYLMFDDDAQTIK